MFVAVMPWAAWVCERARPRRGRGGGGAQQPGADDADADDDDDDGRGQEARGHDHVEDAAAPIRTTGAPLPPPPREMCYVPQMLFSNISSFWGVAIF